MYLFMYTLVRYIYICRINSKELPVSLKAIIANTAFHHDHDESTARK